MKKIHGVILILVLFNLLAIKLFSQKIAKENLLRIANSYIKYSAKKHSLDSNKTIFLFSTGTYNGDSVFLDITFENVDYLVNTKYNDVYKLENFRVLIYEEEAKNAKYIKVLKSIFKKAPYENLNTGKDRDLRMEDYDRWYVNLNNNYEVITIDAIGDKKAIITVLKKNKVILSKKFSFR